MSKQTNHCDIPITVRTFPVAMYITNFEVRNYKSYRAPGPVVFKPGFNIITGQNNVGKTALLEALTIALPTNPHISQVTVPTPGTIPPDTSSVQITFAVSRDEWLSIWPAQPRNFPRPADRFAPDGIRPFDGSPEAVDAFLEWLLNQVEFAISVRVNKPIGGSESWLVEGIPLGLYPPHQVATPTGTRTFISFSIQNHRAVGARFTNLAVTDDTSIRLAQVLKSRIYRFSAERFNIGQCAFGNNTILAASAQNLPEVLNILQGDPQRFAHFNSVVREVLPQLQQVSVRPAGTTMVEATVWPQDGHQPRADLTIPLNQCGSGVGQVLAMLYVVITSNHSQAIIIDEPQSFLHPGAVRKLIEVLQRYPHHQYILATHSPTVIAASDPTTVTMLKLNNRETTFQSVTPTDAKDLQVYLAEIGARLADVFGADSVLWVEGRTEEICFAQILKNLARRSLMGTAILGVRQTGDLESRDAKRVIEIYLSLTRSNALLPPAIAFVLDRECRTTQNLEDLRRASQGLAKFLPCRMYENFLLHGPAIAAVATAIDGFPQEQITTETVTQLIDAKRQDVRYFCRGTVQVPADWVVEVDGARILSEIFETLSERRVSYDKVKHSVAITEWLILHDSDHLRKLADWLIALFPER